MKKIFIVAILIILCAIVFLAITKNINKTSPTPSIQETKTPVIETIEKPVVSQEQKQDESFEIIGTSVEGREITAYHYGEGSTELLFIGGIHGGYEWNTALVAYELTEYLAENQSTIPKGLKITVIPVLNPDGLTAVVGTSERFTKDDVPTEDAATIPGRFNAHTVDLNRNFDCEWKQTSTWQNHSVSGGSAPFSEPESQAIKKYVDSHTIKAVVVWYSAAGGVFSSNCKNGVLPETTVLTNLYAKASGYKAYESFDFYEITGDMVNWFAKIGIPAISVLLTTHDDLEWDKNRSGISAILDHYAQ